ncbi:MAG: aminotransferase class I/II-fold pyridoxal phosphate-dependent enzyme, partial [Wenzhouxiangellaceae bacterium]
MTRNTIQPASRVAEVRYEIRGPLARRAHELERQGHEILHLNVGNPGAFGLHAPETMRQAVVRNLPGSDAYGPQTGIFPAREAVAIRFQERGLVDTRFGQVMIGNGVSELVDLSLRALLEPGDEVLIPAPDYPLWTAATVLNGGRAVHYQCRAENGFLPDPDALEAQITPKTRALVVINPNNPTGAVYPKALL